MRGGELLELILCVWLYYVQDCVRGIGMFKTLVPMQNVNCVCECVCLLLCLSKSHTQ